MRIFVSCSFCCDKSKIWKRNSVKYGGDLNNITGLAGHSFSMVDDHAKLLHFTTSRLTFDW